MPAPTQVVKNKPVATIGGAGTVAEIIDAVAVARGWITPDTGAVIAPVIALLVTLLVHGLVSPYQKVKDVIERGLHITDADYGRLEAVLEQYGLAIVQKDLPGSPEPAPAQDPAAPPAPPTP